MTHAFFTRPRSLLDVFSLGKKAPPFLLQSYFYFVLYGLAAEKPLPCSLYRQHSSPATEPGCLLELGLDYLLLMYSSMLWAASLPAPMARITVAEPVTASPPA